MEFEIFTLADYAADSGNGKLSVIGTFDTIFSPTFPVVQPLCAIAMRVRVANKDARKYRFMIRILTPTKKELVKADGELDVKPHPKFDYNTLNIVFNLTNTTFETEGKYAVECLIDNEWQRGLTLILSKL